MGRCVLLNSGCLSQSVRGPKRVIFALRMELPYAVYEITPLFPPVPHVRVFVRGQIHAVRIKGGKATYSNRYVRTTKLIAEEEAGRPLALK